MTQTPSFSRNNKIKYWYVPLLLGILLIFLGIYVLNIPQQAFAFMITLFSVVFTIEGLMELFFTLKNKNNLQQWGLHFVLSIITVGLGIYLIFNPVSTAFILAIFVAFNLLLKSIQGLFFSITIKNRQSKKWNSLFILSIIGILLSLLVVSQPMILGLSLVVLIGLSFIFVGFIAIMLSLMLKKAQRLFADNRLEETDVTDYEIVE